MNIERMTTLERIAYLEGSIKRLESEMADDLEIFEARKKNSIALIKQWREEQFQLQQKRMEELGSNY